MSRMHHALALFVLLSAAAPRAEAQGESEEVSRPGEGEAAEATNAEEGPAAAAARHQARALELLTEAEVSEAIREFDLSIAIHPTPEARFNRAAALRRMGRLVEARQQLMSLRREIAEGRLSLAIEREQEELETELPSIMVRVPDADEAEIRIDGLLYGVGGGANSVATPVDPGTHVVDVREGQRAGRRELEVQRGEVARVDIDLDEILGQDPRIRRRRLGGALAAVVVVLGVAAVFIATQVQAAEPRMLFDEGVVPRVETLQATHMNGPRL